MSADSHSEPAYNPLVIKAWGTLSALVGLLILGMLSFGPWLLPEFHKVWDLIRWLFSPLI